MASHIFWIDSVTRRLVAGFNSSLQAETPIFVQGDRAEIEIHLLSPTGNLATIYAELDLSEAGVRLAIGRIEAKPTSGSFRLAAGEDLTPPLAFNSSAEALQSALNALPAITALGGVTVQGGIGGPWFVYYTQPGVRDLLTSDSSLLLPISQVLVTATRAGTESVAAIHQVKLKQSPAAYQDDWSDLPPADVLVERKVPGGPGANEVQRIKLLPAPYGGSYTLRFGNETTTPLSFSSSAQNIQDALWALPSIGEGNVTVVEVTTGIFDVQFTGALANAAQELLSSDGTSLLVHSGKLGALELNTPNVEDLLSGQDRVDAVLEVEITIGGAPRTYLQTPCVVLNDMIEGAPPVPIIPFARAVLTDAQGQVIAPPNFWALALSPANPLNVLGLMGFSMIVQAAVTKNSFTEFLTALGALNTLATSFFTVEAPVGCLLTSGDGNTGEFISLYDYRQGIIDSTFSLIADGTLNVWFFGLIAENITGAQGASFSGGQCTVDEFGNVLAQSISADQNQEGGFDFDSGTFTASIRMPLLTADRSIEVPDQEGTISVIKASRLGGTRVLNNNDDQFLFCTSSEESWTLPPLSGGRRLPFYIKHVAGSFLSVAAASGDQIYTQNETQPAVSFMAGQTGIFINDGTYWQYILIP